MARAPATPLLLACSLLLASARAPAQIEAQPSALPSALPAAPVLTRAPAVLAFVHAEYPEQARRLGIAGEVRLELDLDATGAVARVTVLEAPDPSLAEAAEAAVRAFRFSPAEIDGQPAPIRIEYRYVFTLAAPDKDGASDALAAAPATQATAWLSGRVLRAGHRTPIPGAFGQLDGTTFGFVSASDGSFRLGPLEGGSYTLRIEAPGHAPWAQALAVVPWQEALLTCYLLRLTSDPFETVVRGERRALEVTTISLQRDEVTAVPGTFGDPLRVIENLPGMGRTPGGLGGALLIRGAAPEDSGVYLDGVEIPLLYHFGGFVSVINPEFLQTIDFLPGGFGARYGDATGGIVEVGSRQLEPALVRGAFELDLIDVAAFASVPLGDWQIAAAARRSHIDALLPAAFSVLDVNPGATLVPRYWDYQLKVSGVLEELGPLELFAFGSDDRFLLVREGGLEDRSASVGYHTAFHRLLAQQRATLGPGLTLTSRPWIGIDLIGLSASSDIDGFGVNVDFAMPRGGLREELAWRPREWLDLLVGLEWQVASGRYDTAVPIDARLASFPSPTPDFTATQPVSGSIPGYQLALYAEGRLEPLPGLRLTLGARAEHDKLGAALNDTLLPRLTVRYTLPEWWPGRPTVCKAAWGLYRQMPQLQQVIADWGNPDLDLERASHLVLGAEQQLTERLALRLEGFYIDRSRLVVFSDARTLTADGRYVYEWYNNDGVGYTYGLELLLRHDFTERFYGWVAYTLSRSWRRAHPDWDWYLAAFDQTHILTVVAQLRLPWDLGLGARLRLISGNPYTPVTGAVYDADQDRYLPLYGPWRSRRMPTFHQLDLRLDRRFTFDTWVLTPYLELINSYNADNVEQYEYDFRYGQAAPISLLPIIPVLGVKGEW